MMDAKKAQAIYWGGSPLPKGAICLGEYNQGARKGAMIQLANGRRVQGNAGSIRAIPE